MIALSWELKAAAILLALAGLLGGAWAFMRYESGLGAAEVQARWDGANAISAATAASAAAGNQAESARRTAAQQENDDETQRQQANWLALHDAQVARTALARDGVQHTTAAIAARSGVVPGDPAAAQQCAADVRALASVFSECSSQYTALAADAEQRVADARSRGSECSGDYDALTPASAPSAAH